MIQILDNLVDKCVSNLMAELRRTVEDESEMVGSGVNIAPASTCNMRFVSFSRHWGWANRSHVIMAEKTGVQTPRLPKDLRKLSTAIFQVWLLMLPVWCLLTM